MSKKVFEKIDFTKESLAKGEYENCVFAKCNFLNFNFSEFKFYDCEFIDCDLSLIKLTQTGFINVKFKNSKLLGLLFENCNDFGLSVGFENCLLNQSSFYKTNMKATLFKNCQLREADLTNCDLNGSIFDNCDFAGAIFRNTIIEKADFRTSYNYLIDPEANRIKKAKFSAAGAIGLLVKYDIEIF